MAAFYHLVTRHRLRVGQVLDFSAGQLNRQATFFLGVPANLNLRDILKQTQLSTLPATDRGRHALRELVLERVRVQSFPELPSRLSCLYAATSVQQALAWQTLFENEGRHVLQLVKGTTTGPVFYGDAAKLPTVADETSAVKILAAQNYWRYPAKDQRLSEVLVSGRVTVDEIVNEF
ncbi:DUF2441 domain-containing protein [Levilactobacillus andaensis]|uniref:DUF2441 domain-containing protein n=1 Tax=Levilactobacillus andaensis TaxID=2799570 RepID=UPI0019443640|nr:DUF2441 domain-containing protein [Levilactobacillus andaensis]